MSERGGVALPSPEVTRPAGWCGFDTVDFYFVTLAPFDAERMDDIGTASLDDDVLDIYRDVRDGLHHVDRGRFGTAEFTWKTLFDSHWGGHAVNALRALQLLCDR